MAYFPLFVSLKGKRCLVVGGGRVAFRKAGVMLEYGADVVAVAEEFCPEMKRLIEEGGKEGEGRIEGICRRAAAEDAEGMDLVLCASCDEGLHREVASYCRKNRIWVNVADNREESGFLFPALVRQGELVLGITTGGNSPSASRYLREKISEGLPLGMGRLVERLGGFRPLVKAALKDQQEREAVFSRLFFMGMEKNGEIGEEDVRRVIREIEEAK